MPWRERTRVNERIEFVELAQRPDANVSALCRRFGVSRKNGYKWLSRPDDCTDRSRRPHASPTRTAAVIEEQVCDLRRMHPAWGGRKLRRVLINDGVLSPPAASTITDILARHQLLAPDRRTVRDWTRFEHAAPNDLWQMDFKGHVAMSRGRCHPLTILDDHSRFSISLSACSDERADTVQPHLTAAFARYGLPERMLMDNGAPWGSDQAHPHTHLTAWLIRLGITVLHGRPYHPQTQGKEERFHRTLKAEVLRDRMWDGLDEMQTAFDDWRRVYNTRRPHEALNMETPITRYRPSERSLPAVLPEIVYARGDAVRRVQDKGRISFRGREHLVSRAFIGQPVALRATADGVWDVYYCHQRVGHIDHKNV